jgi:hypothetical protein
MVVREPKLKVKFNFNIKAQTCQHFSAAINRADYGPGSNASIQIQQMNKESRKKPVLRSAGKMIQTLINVGGR